MRLNLAFNGSTVEVSSWTRRHARDDVIKQVIISYHTRLRAHPTLGLYLTKTVYYTLKLHSLWWGGRTLSPFYFTITTNPRDVILFKFKKDLLVSLEA